MFLAVVRLRQAAAVLAIAALLVSGGSHWVLLQSVAWAGMLVRYSQQADLTTAVEMTFDGQHPCPLCHTVQEGRRAEQQQQPLVQVERGPDCMLVLNRVVVPAFRIPYEPVSYRSVCHLDLLSSPAKPVPRSVA